MYVSEIWRYPVKSLRGEELPETEIRKSGLPGDREIVIFSPAGRVVTSRTKPKLLGLRGELGRDGITRINGHPWDSEEAGELVREATGEPSALVRHLSVERFDVLPLLVATDGAVQHLGIDRRRLRPNIVIGGVSGLEERNWPGRILAIGDVQISIVKLRERCVMTTYDPDTQAQDRSVLVRIVKEFDGTMALDCAALRGGRIRVGDPVHLLAPEGES